MSPGSRPSHGTFPAELPATSRIAPRTTITSPKPRRIFPRSAIAPSPLDGQQSLPAGSSGSTDSEMSIGRRRRLAAGRRTDEEADLEQERLNDLGQRLGLIVDRRRDGLEPDGTAAVL